MRICFFSGDISRTGGTERVATIIANGLQERGYDISILSYTDGYKSGFKLNKDIKLYTLIKDKEILKSRVKRNIYPTIELYKFIKKENIDVLIDIDIILSRYTIPLKLVSNIKIISWEHFNLNNNNGVKQRDIARRLASKFSNKIIVLNKEDLKNYECKFKNIKNIEYIYNPSVYSKVELVQKREKIVLAVGRLTYQKGFDLLLEAWGQVKDYRDEWILNIVGSGELKKELENKIEDMKLKNVKILPFTSNIEEFYKKASLYVMSSRFEGFPMVLLEAQAFGLPIVSFDCKTGPREIVNDNVDGFLVEDEDCKKLALKINTLINNEKLLKEYSINAKKNSKKFEIDKILDRWVEIINDI